MNRSELEKYVSYVDGQLIRISTNRPCGSLDTSGYLQATIAGKRYQVHRLVWVWFNDCLPDGDLDHINRVRHDNRIENLRIVSGSQNKQNSTKYKNNTSGFKGVSLAGKWGTWKAQIQVGRKKKYLGSFETKEQAYACYLKAVAKLHTTPPV